MEIDKIKALTAVCSLLTALSGWLGFDSWQANQYAEASRQQVTNVVNHYYQQCR